MKILKKDINKFVYNMCVIKFIGCNVFNGGVIIIFLIIIILFYLFLLRWIVYVYLCNGVVCCVCIMFK